MWRVKQHDDDDDDDGSVSPPEESLVQTLNRKIADLHMQLDASEAAVRHLEQQKKGGKKLKKGFSSRKFSLKKKWFLAVPYPSKQNRFRRETYLS